MQTDKQKLEEAVRSLDELRKLTWCYEGIDDPRVQEWMVKATKAADRLRSQVNELHRKVYPQDGSLRGLYENLFELALDEGVVRAVKVADEWARALEAMAEAGSKDERGHIHYVQREVDRFLKDYTSGADETEAGS